MEKKATEKNMEIINVEESNPFFIIIHTGNTSIPILQERLLEHWHKELEINYIINGTCTYYIDGCRYNVKKDDIIIINSSSVHRIEPSPKNNQYNEIALTIIIEYGLMKHILPDFDNCLLLPQKLNNHNKVVQALLEIKENYQYNSSDYKNILITGMIYKLIYQLCMGGAKFDKTIIPNKKRKHIETLTKIIDYIERNYTQPIKEQDIADEFFFSREYISRLFKKYTNISYKEYLTRYRLKKAKDILLSSDSSVADIALSVGFSDSRQFITTFKKYYGTTPYKYKNISLNNLVTKK